MRKLASLSKTFLIGPRGFPLPLQSTRLELNSIFLISKGKDDFQCQNDTAVIRISPTGTVSIWYEKSGRVFLNGMIFFVSNNKHLCLKWKITAKDR